MKSTKLQTANEVLRPAERVATLTAYSIPAAQRPIRLRLDRNEGRPWLDSTLTADVNEEVLRRYPSAAELESLLARHYGVSNQQVIVTAGGDDALARVCAAFLEPGREMLLAVPTFEMLSRYCWLAGGELVEVPWLESDFPLEAFLDRLSPRTALVAVVSPNNPTGSVVTGQQLTEIANRASSALLLLDLAYAEFAGEDLMGLVRHNPRALAVRTFSKAWGLAGLRVGYAVGSPETIRWLRAAGNPYAVAGPSVAIATEQWRRGAESMRRFVDSVKAERRQLEEFLRQRGVDAFPSQANFVFARLDNAEHVWNELGRRGIAVRWFGNQPFLQDALRITCPGDGAEFQELLQALSQILRAE